MKSSVLVAVAFAGGIWLVRLPYRLDPFTFKLSRLVALAVVVLFVLGLVVGVAEAFRSKDKLAFWFSIAGVLGAAAGLILFATSYVGAHATTSAENQCINNLRELDRVVEQIAMEQNLKPGTRVPESEILRRADSKNLKCPEGGIYSYGVIGEAPKCSMPGHTVR